MKPKMLNFIATAIVGCLGLGETAHASPSEFFPLLPPSCARQAYAEHVANFENPSFVGGTFTNRAEPWAEQTLYAAEFLNRFDSPPTILIHEASRGYDKKVTKKQRIAARRLVSYYERKVAIFNPLLEVGDLTYEPGTVTFSCFTATCPQGVQCKSVSQRLQAEAVLSSLPIRRQFFERIMKIPLLIQGSIGNPSISADLSRLQDVSMPGRAISSILRGLGSVVDSATGN